MIEIRRNVRLATVITAGAGVVALAFLVRGGAVSTVVGMLFLALAAAAAWALYDGRTPLMVLDDQGVRMRLGRDWRGIPWTGIDEIEHLPRPLGAAGMWRDGRLAILPLDEPAEVMALTDSGARQAAWTQRLFGVPFAVPLGMTTTVIGNDKPLTLALAELAGTSTRVVEIDPSIAEIPVIEDTGAFTVIRAHDDAEVAAESVGSPTPEAADGEDTLGEDIVREDTVEVSRPTAVGETFAPPVALTQVPAMRETYRPIRVEASFEPMTVGANALAAEYEPRAMVEVVDPEPESIEIIEPVIGPQIVHARQRYGLSIDALAERTRIRPHVLEAIEVDDFAACGGDFYARGHLRTIARVLGLDGTELVDTYADNYGSAPIDPREVFAAEFSNDSRIRPATGGPQWSVLIASGMAVILLWSLVRLFTAGAAPEAGPGISLEGNVTSPYAKIAPPVPVVLKAAGSGVHVVVKDSTDTVVFSGDLAFGASKTVQAAPPVKITSSDGSLTVAVSGGQAAAIGTQGAPAVRTYTADN